jgi:putative Ca2+/H+ antiporter (TMEM165/GDT1 family)
MDALILSLGARLPERAIRIGAAVAFVVSGLVLVWRGVRS